MIVSLKIGGTTSSASVYDVDHGAECVPNTMGEFRTPSATARSSGDAIGYVVGESALKKRVIPQANLVANAPATVDQKSWTFPHRQYHGRNESIIDDSKDMYYHLSLIVHSLLQDVWRRNSGHDVKRFQMIVISLSQFASQPMVDALVLAAGEGYALLRKYNDGAKKALPEATPPVTIIPNSVAILYSLSPTFSSEVGGKGYVIALRCGGLSISASVMKNCISAVTDSYGSLDGLVYGEWRIVSNIFCGSAKPEDVSSSGCGGDDVDRKIMQDFQGEHFEAFISTELTKKKKLALLNQCAEAKMNLLSTKSPVSIDFDHEDDSLTFTLTPERFNDLCRPLCERLKTAVEEAVKQAKIPVTDVSHIVTFGGSINLPPLASVLSTVCPSATIVEGNSQSQGLSDDKVSLGACAYAKGQNVAQASLLNTPCLANPHFEENLTEFALLVELHGGTFGMLTAPQERYPCRVVKEMSIHSQQAGSKLRLIATKTDMSTFLCEVGYLPSLTFPFSEMEGGDDSALSKEYSTSNSSGGPPFPAQKIQLFVEVGIEGCVRTRILHPSSGVEISATFGPIPQLAAP